MKDNNFKTGKILFGSKWFEDFRSVLKRFDVLLVDFFLWMKWLRRENSVWFRTLIRVIKQLKLYSVKRVVKTTER